MHEGDLMASQFLRDHFGNRVRGCAPLAAGEWSRAYALELDGRDAVVRFGAFREDFEKDRVMGRYGSADLPIPAVLEVGEAPFGFYAVSERVRGQSIEALDEPAMRDVIPELLAALDALKALDISTTRGDGYWDASRVGLHPTWADALSSVADPGGRIAGWRENLDRTPAYARLFDRGVEKLRQLAPQLRHPRAIVHGDLLGNVLVDAGRVSGVIDWGNALYGDPLYDVAWLFYWWPWYQAWQDIDLPEIVHRHWQARGGPPAMAEERLRCCLIHIGLSHVAYCAFKGRSKDLRRHAEQVAAYL